MAKLKIVDSKTQLDATSAQLADVEAKVGDGNLRPCLYLCLSQSRFVQNEVPKLGYMYQYTVVSLSV